MSRSKTLVVQNNPKSPVSEAYRVLRTNLQFASLDNPLKVIIITSSGPGEGKTTTAVNLAITFAQSGSKTLLVDGDLRKPIINRVFGLNNQKGITNILALQEDYNWYINKCPTENLDIITSGAIPPNPSELLASNAMKEFVHKLRDDYDMIIIDSPPVGSVTDAAILSTIADGTVLVASSGKVEIEAITRAKELLVKVNANILGVVLNRLDRKAKGNDYYYSYYYYSEDNDKQKKKNKKSKAKIKLN